MARVTITPVKATKYNTASAEITSASLTTAVDATDGAAFSMTEADEKYLILVQNAHASAAKDFTLKAGNGLQGAGDYTVSVAAGKTVFVGIESGRFKNVTGADKDKVVMTGGSADIKVAVFVVP